MPGHLCTGVSTQYGFLPKESKAFSEGVYYRAGGTLAGRPKASNPHAVGTSAHDAWDAGWQIADDQAPAGSLSPSDAPCVAIPTNTIVDA